MRPPRHYKFYYFNHHKFTGDPATDPELQDSFIDLKLDNPLSYALYLSGLPFWLDRTTTLIRHAALSWVLPREVLDAAVARYEVNTPSGFATKPSTPLRR